MKCDIQYKINFLSIEYEIYSTAYVKTNMGYYERVVAILRTKMITLMAHHGMDIVSC